jgi:hypothetical protein
VNWLAASVSLRKGDTVLIIFLYVQFDPPANGKTWPVPQEMSQTLLTNNKQGKFIKYTPLTLLSHAPWFA